LFEACEKILERDLRKNNCPALLYQFLLDFARFGLAITLENWQVDTVDVEMKVPGEIVMDPVLGVTSVTGDTTQEEEVVKFEGNKLENVSPYVFLPDTRVPLTKWKEGQFCGHESEYHIEHLKQMERDGILSGTEHIEKMDATVWKERGVTRLRGMEAQMSKNDNKENDFMCCMTYMQISLVPKDYELGEETTPRDFVVRVVNDVRVVGVERAGYLHHDKIYNVAQLSPDMHCVLNESLSDVIHSLQDVVTWLINARILAVRNSLENHMVVDPSVVDMSDVEARSPVIKMLKGAPRTGVTNFIQQLRVVDTTTGHFQDADMLMGVMRTVTGVNENAMGQYAPGRRSATENRAANSGAAARMKMQITIAYSSALGPQGLKMLTNARQGMSLETFVKILGRGKEELYAQFRPADPRELVGGEDFMMFDATQVSEKAFLAQSLQELLVTMVNNPEVMMATQFDLPEAVKQLQYLRGINNASRFFRTGPPPLLGNGVDPATGQPIVPVPGPPDVGSGASA